MWTKTAFKLDRSIIQPSPSCYSASQRKNIVGKRADTILLDDFEVGNNTESEEKRKKLEKDAEKLFPLSNGRVFFVGTPHTEDSIYWKRQNPKFKTACLKIPIMDENGVPANDVIPVGGILYDREWIAETRETLSEGEFQSQYMLENTKFGESKINYELVNTFRGGLGSEETEDWKTGRKGWRNFVSVDGKQIPVVGISAFWDWAKGDEGNDDSVVSIVANDEQRNVYVLEMAKMPPVTKGQTFRAQCETALKLCADYGIGTLHAEVTGNSSLSGELHSVAAEIYDRRSINVHIDEVHRSGNQHTKFTSKNKRIEHHLEPIVRIGRLWIREHLWADTPEKKDQPLRGQMIDFPHSKKDDYLDALAGALEYLQPVPVHVASHGAIGERPFNSHYRKVRKTRRNNGF
jgi:phage terminase large subunit-like protein